MDDLINISISTDQHDGYYNLVFKAQSRSSKDIENIKKKLLKPFDEFLKSNEPSDGR